MLASFLRGYRRSTGELDNNFLKHITIHLGVWLVFWPTHSSHGWGTEEETGEMIGVGCELMKRALDGEEKWLAETLLNDLQE